MDQTLRDAYEAARRIDGKPFRSACYTPYTSLYFHTNGDVIACCKNTSYRLGNISQDRLDDIWRGRRVQALRKALRQYNFKLGCEFCEWQIQGGQFDQVYATAFDRLPLDREDPEWPSMLEFTVSNTCNLACVMCYGELSSTIRAQRDNLPPLAKVYGDQFFADLRKYLPHLRIAKFFGGEPFLAQENYRIWDMMIEDRLRPACHVTTNGTQWNSRVERVLDAFPVHVAVSMDGVTKATVESIRVNARYETLVANIDRFLDYVRRGKTTMSLTYCLMRQNWHEYGAYLRFGEERQLDVFVNTVIDPPDCSLYTLPPAELLQIVEAMCAQDAEHGFRALPLNGRRWSSAVDALRKNAQERQVQGLGGVREAARALKAAVRPDHTSRAWALAGEGRLEDAVAESRKVQPHDADAYQARIAEGSALRRLGRLEEAEAVLLAAAAAWRRSPKAWIQLGWLRFDQGRIDAAFAMADEAARHLADGAHAADAPWVRNLQWHLLCSVDRWTEALAAARLVPQDHALAFDAAVVEARTCRMLDQLDAADAAIGRALELRPAAPRALLERAALRLRQGRLAEGLADGSAALVPAEAAGDQEQVAAVCRVLSSICAAAGDLQAAAAWAGRQLQAMPHHEGTLLEHVRMLAELGRRREAHDLLASAIATWCRSPKACLQLGWLRLDAGDPEAALAAAHEAERCAAGAPAADVAPWLASLACHALCRLERWDEALAAAAAIPRDHALAFEAAIVQARICRTLARHDAAERAIADAQQIRPAAVAVLVERAWLRHAEQRLAEGQRDGLAAIARIEAGHEQELLGAACHVMAELCRAEGQLAAAESWATRLHAALPDRAEFLLLRAGLRQLLGRFEEAQHDARAALALAPDDARVRAFLAGAPPTG